MAKKTILIDESIHVRMKNLGVPISSFVEEAILYALHLHQKGYRIIDGTLYQAATGDSSSIISSDNVVTKKETNPTKEDSINNDSPSVKNSDEFMS